MATATSGLGPFWDVAAWWPELIVYEKLILWTVLLETLGLAGSWGPLAAHFKPMTGGFRYWARPDTIRLPPWPDKVPFTRGDRRTVGDVALYLAIIATAIAALVAPTVTRTGVSLVNPVLLLTLIGLLIVMGLRDKVVFLAARSEQYLPALVFFAVLGPVDLVIALKLLIVVVWIGAGVSKFGRHFSRVVAPMVSNTPWAPRALKRINYRSFPDDLRPSHAAGLLAHIGGTTVEIVLPLVLLFSTNPTVTLLAVIGMVVFHLFILSTFPIAVPLEWNVLFAFATVFLFWGHPAWEGYSVADISSPGCSSSPSLRGWSSSRSSATCVPTWCRSCRRCASTPATGRRPRGRSRPAPRPSSTTSCGAPATPSTRSPPPTRDRSPRCC